MTLPRQVSRTGFVRLRWLLVSLPFVMPVATTVCAALALEGVTKALYVLVVIGILGLSTRCVKAYNEYRMVGTTGLGCLDLGTAVASQVTKAVSSGMHPDSAVSSTFGLGIGLVVAHFGWTPSQVRDAAYAAAIELDRQQGKV